MTTQTKLTQEQLKFLSKALMARTYGYFCETLVFDYLSEPDFLLDVVGPDLEEEGLEPLPTDFNWKDLNLKTFEVNIEVDYED